MKTTNQIMVFVGWLVAAAFVVYSGIWCYNYIRASGYEGHKAEVAFDLANGRQAQEDLVTHQESLKQMTAEKRQLEKQLKVAELEREALKVTLKALVDLNTDKEGCAAKTSKDPNRSNDCPDRPWWWTKRHLTVDQGGVKMESQDRSVLAHYEFVRDSKGEIVDFKLLPDQAARK